MAMNEKRSMDRRAFCAMAAGGAALGVAGSLTGTNPVLADSASPGRDPAQPAPIYVVDRVVTKPGDGEAFYRDYMETYAPVAEAYGATLASVLVAPPIWLPMDSNTITFTWKVAGVGGSWGIAAPRADLYDWWKAVHERVVEQDRSYYADPADMEEICHV